MSYTRDTGPRDRQLRAADADREAVAEVLRREHLAGRLNDSELDSRLAACFAAVTYADLDALITDLPPERRADRRPSFRAPYWPLPLLPLLLVLVVLSHGHALWLLVPFTLFFLFRRGRRSGGWACGARSQPDG